MNENLQQLNDKIDTIDQAYKDRITDLQKSQLNNLQMMDTTADSIDKIT